MRHWTRRDLGKTAAAGALLGGGGLALTACAGGATSAHPSVATPAVEITFGPWNPGLPITAVITQVMGEALQGFTRAHPGIRVKVVPPPGGCCNPAALTAALVAGAAPDIVINNQFGPYAVGGYLLPLDAYLQRDNVNPDIWSPAQMRSFRTAQGTFALPTYFNTTCYFLNLSAFDAAGLNYPSPAWTHQDFVRVAAALSGTSGAQRKFGCNLWWWTAQAWGSDWAFAAFGGAKVGSGGLHCLLNEPKSVQAGDWIYQQVLWPQIGATQDTFGGYTKQFVSGQTAMSVQQTGTLLTAVAQLATAGLKWDIQPFPVFPAGRTCFGGDQFYAINGRSKHPEQAWELLKWLCAGTEWQAAMMKLFLSAPALNALWPQWEATIQAVAPPLRGKQIHWFSDAAIHGYAIPAQYFLLDDLSAETIISGLFGALTARRTGVRAAFNQAATQVNALEAAARKQPQTTLRQQVNSRSKEKARLTRLFGAG